MTPYYTPSPNYEVDIEETLCRSCNTPTLYLDHAAGDTVCTSCGLVHSQHYKSTLAEWRDYSSIDPDSAGRNVTSRAGSMVDESRWAGGLEPTALGRIYNPSGSASHGNNNAGLEGYRRKIGKMKRVVDKFVEREFERHVEEGKVALRLKEKKRKMGRKSLRGNCDDQENVEDEDWTEFGTNEHEEIAKQRMEDFEKSNKLFMAEKWSLDRALLLHGDEHEIPSQYLLPNPLNGEKARDLENERQILTKRMDKAQRNASADLYCAYKLIQTALKILNLNENTRFNNDVLSTVCKFADMKGNFRIKGVASRISSDVKKNDMVLYEQLLEYCKQRQISALASAVIHMECKKSNVGRTVKEICSSFAPTASCANIEKLKLETFVKTKHLFKAVHEIKELLPDYAKLVSSNPSSSSPNTTSSCSKSKVQTESQVDHLVKKLNLSSTASTAISKLVLSYRTTNLVGSKKSALLASMIYLVCDAAALMQRLSKSALEKKKKDEVKKTTKIKQEYASAIKIKQENDLTVKMEGSEYSSSSGIKRKHIRPNVSRTKIRKLSNASLSGDDEMLKPLEVVSSSSSPADNSVPSVMQSYYGWSCEKPWYRSLKQIEQSCNVTEAIICDFYKREVYPKRNELLSLLENSQDSRCSHDEKDNILLSNIASVAPLMVVARKLK